MKGCQEGMDQRNNFLSYFVSLFCFSLALGNMTTTLVIQFQFLFFFSMFQWLNFPFSFAHSFKILCQMCGRALNIIRILMHTKEKV